MITKLKQILNTLGFRKTTPKFLAIATLVGCTIGYLPGKLVNFLAQTYPSVAPEGLEQLNQLLAMQDPMLNTILFIMIALIMPILEEVVFRGVLWAGIEKLTKNVHAVAFTTTALFAIVHMDLLHIIGVFPIGLAFAYLRGYSRSLYPALLAHIVNNTISISSAFI